MSDDTFRPGVGSYSGEQLKRALEELREANEAQRADRLRLFAQGIGACAVCGDPRGGRSVHPCLHVLSTLRYARAPFVAINELAGYADDEGNP
jgi:hypothetical protein